MEDALRALFRSASKYFTAVLILILMEDALRVKNFEKIYKATSRLNPYSDGRCSKSRKDNGISRFVDGS